MQLKYDFSPIRHADNYPGVLTSTESRRRDQPMAFSEFIHQKLGQAGTRAEPRQKRGGRGGIWSEKGAGGCSQPRSGSQEGWEPSSLLCSAGEHAGTPISSGDSHPPARKGAGFKRWLWKQQHRMAPAADRALAWDLLIASRGFVSRVCR